MHIQDPAAGGNGAEINQWKQFGLVQQRIVDAHNAAIGNRQATTVPAGSALTL